MTQKANPSPNRPAEAFKTAGAIGYGGHSEGYVVSGTETTPISEQDSGIDETVLNAFIQTSSATSTSVDIDPGEAFVFGAWLAKDTTTTVSLPTNSTTTVFVGWDKGSTDDVIVGRDNSFTNASDDTDQKIPLFDFTTDGSGVTGVEDRRRIGKTVDGAIEHRNSTQTGDYTTSGEGIIFADTSSGPVTITIQTNDSQDGRELVVIDAGGNANANNITIDTENGRNIDGSTSTNITSDYGAARLTSDGSDWYSAGGGGGGGGGIGEQLYTRNPRY
jgi:hypothetical protein